MFLFRVIGGTCDLGLVMTPLFRCVGAGVASVLGLLGYADIALDLDGARESCGL